MVRQQRNKALPPFIARNTASHKIMTVLMQASAAAGSTHVTQDNCEGFRERACVLKAATVQPVVFPLHGILGIPAKKSSVRRRQGPPL